MVDHDQSVADASPHKPSHYPTGILKTDASLATLQIGKSVSALSHRCAGTITVICSEVSSIVNVTMQSSTQGHDGELLECPIACQVKNRPNVQAPQTNY